ncbi:LysR family transcriptional regulator [Pseudomonas atacamensis]|uniref:LysR family transcriptional regulator n=1 Tax=Pseudomonas atacamensis TaxID=2565368 RepID=A0AAQ2D741_9PSED|nr:LysR family transcriptional regulator [Pseudomonas atacamensis]THF25795.1 LysR family transcriptional regulator [Pseudomonas atacamensis]
MEIKHLRYFIQVAETLSFNRAAERLNSSQPVVTRVIAQLEHSIGAKLFERTTRRVALTAAGLVLLSEARPLIIYVESVQRNVRHAVAKRSNRFTVGTTPIGMQTVTPVFLRHFNQIYPDAQLEVRELPSQAQIEALLSAEIDLGFILNTVSHPALSSRILRRERMRLAVPDDHPYAHAAANHLKVPLTAFAGDCFIIPSKQAHPAVYEEVIKACDVAGFRPQLKECAENQTCMGLARAGLGVFFFPGKQTDLSDKGLVVLDIVDPVPIIEVAAAWRTDDPSAFLMTFLERSWEDDPLQDHSVI